MKIIVTGGCGFIGSAICIYLREKLKFSNIISIDNLSKDYSRFNEKILKKNGIKNFKIDLGSYHSLKKINFKSDIIIDCSADPAVEDSRKNVNRVFKNNLVSTLNVLEKVSNDKSFLIFLSTSRVYPVKLSYQKFKNRKKYLYNENTSTEGPKTIYGFTKLASEMLIQEYYFMNNINYIINRCGLITGPGQFGKVEQGLISLWLWRHLNNLSVTYKGYYGKGSQIRDVLYITDLCDLIFKQIKNRNKVYSQTFCVGGGYKNSISLKKLTHLCRSISRNKTKIKKELTTSIYDIPYYVSSNFKLKQVYNWSPKVDIVDSLKNIYYWMKKNKNLIKRFF